MKATVAAPRPVPGRPAAPDPVPTLPDRVWQLVFWAGFRAARICWGLQRRQHEGALVAVRIGPDLLLLRSSYRREWNFPGGGVRTGETPADAARREMEEEIGLSGELAGPGTVITGIWDNRPDRVHIFDLQLDCLPSLRLDRREVVGARLFSPEELASLPVSGPVAAYLARHRGAGKEMSGRMHVA